jgi:acyl carrier protein
MKITKNQILHSLQNSCPDLDFSKINESTSFNELNLDSMDLAAFFLDIEDNFNLKVKNSDFNKLNTIEKVMIYFNKPI